MSRAELLPDASDASHERGVADSIMTLWDFGVDVDAAAPPADEVIEFDENNPDPALALLRPLSADIGAEQVPATEEDGSRLPANWTITSGTWRT